MVLSCYKGAYIHGCTSGSRNVVKGAQPSAKIVGACQCTKRAAILIIIIKIIVIISYRV